MHRIVSKDRIYSACVQSVFRYMELKHGQWRLMTLWDSHLERTERMHWWDEFAGVSLKDRKRQSRIYASFLVLIVLLMWWGVERLRWFGHLERKSCGSIGCLLAEGWWWRGREVEDGVGRHGNSVLGMTWNCLVCILSGLFLGICGGTWFGANVWPLA